VINSLVLLNLLLNNLWLLRFFNIKKLLIKFIFYREMKIFGVRHWLWHISILGYFIFFLILISQYLGEDIFN